MGMATLPLLPKSPQQGNLVITRVFSSNFAVVSSNWRVSAGNFGERVCISAIPDSVLKSPRGAEVGCVLYLWTSRQSLGFPALFFAR